MYSAVLPQIDVSNGCSEQCEDSGFQPWRFTDERKDGPVMVSISGMVQ
jgi:hypothetical protein